MEKRYHCNCTTGCDTYRCSCLKHHKPCDESCGCVDCRNPLNDVDVEGLTACAIQNIEKVKILSEEALEERLQLPCGHESATLGDLLKTYCCKTCAEAYWYSFCWDAVVQDSCTWHCEACHQCRDWREWHCEVCGNCIYGVTMPCQYCGNPGEMMDLF